MLKGGKIPTLKLDNQNKVTLEMLKDKPNKHSEWLSEALKDIDYRLFQMAKYTKIKYAYFETKTEDVRIKDDAIVYNMSFNLIPIEEAPECFVPNERCIFLDPIREFIKKEGACAWSDINMKDLQNYYQEEKRKILEREQK